LAPFVGPVARMPDASGEPMTMPIPLSSQRGKASSSGAWSSSV
jgi:hypothetical protein